MWLKMFFNSEFKINFIYNTYYVCLSLGFQYDAHQFVWQSRMSPTPAGASLRKRRVLQKDPSLLPFTKFSLASPLGQTRLNSF